MTDDSLESRPGYLLAPAVGVGFFEPGNRGCTTIAEADMSQRTFSLVAGVVFDLIALGHVLRIVLGWSFVIQDFSIPMWASWIAAIIMGYLAYEGFRLARKSGV